MEPSMRVSQVNRRAGQTEHRLGGLRPHCQERLRGDIDKWTRVVVDSLRIS